MGRFTPAQSKKLPYTIRPKSVVRAGACSSSTSVEKKMRPRPNLFVVATMFWSVVRAITCAPKLPPRHDISLGKAQTTPHICTQTCMKTGSSHACP